MSNVRQCERDWLAAGGHPPEHVRAVWFLSSVLVNKVPSIRKATHSRGTTEQVEEALRTLVSLGAVADQLLSDIESEVSA